MNRIWKKTFLSRFEEFSKLQKQKEYQFRTFSMPSVQWFIWNISIVRSLPFWFCFYVSIENDEWSGGAENKVINETEDFPYKRCIDVRDVYVIPCASNLTSNFSNIHQLVYQRRQHVLSEAISHVLNALLTSVTDKKCSCHKPPRNHVYGKQQFAILILFKTNK